MDCAMLRGVARDFDRWERFGGGKKRRGEWKEEEEEEEEEGEEEGEGEGKQKRTQCRRQRRRRRQEAFGAKPRENHRARQFAQLIRNMYKHVRYRGRSKEVWNCHRDSNSARGFSSSASVSTQVPTWKYYSYGNKGCLGSTRRAPDRASIGCRGFGGTSGGSLQAHRSRHHSGPFFLLPCATRCNASSTFSQITVSRSIPLHLRERTCSYVQRQQATSRS
ncbi:hypothetical protein V8C35DRAFT_81448 [Trichoderma chlorosporum]